MRFIAENIKVVIYSNLINISRKKTISTIFECFFVVFFSRTLIDTFIYGFSHFLHKLCYENILEYMYWERVFYTFDKYTSWLFWHDIRGVFHREYIIESVLWYVGFEFDLFLVNGLFIFDLQF